MRSFHHEELVSQLTFDQTLDVVKQVFAATVIWFANSKSMCQSEMIEISFYVPWLPWKGSSHYLQLGSFWPGWCRFGVGNISGFCVCVWGACGLAYFLLERLVFQWNASNVQFPAKRPEIVVHLASIKNNWDLEALGREIHHFPEKNGLNMQFARPFGPKLDYFFECVSYFSLIFSNFLLFCFAYVLLFSFILWHVIFNCLFS